VRASNVTVAHLSVSGGASGNADGVRVGTAAISVTAARVYDVHFTDVGDDAVEGALEADDGEVACSQFVHSATARADANCEDRRAVLGIGVSGWSIRDSTFEGFWCPTAPSDGTVEYRQGARATRIERNVFVDNHRAILLGRPMAEANKRSYDDNPCAGAVVDGHYGGLVMNNFISAFDSELLASTDGIAYGIGAFHSCDVAITHNSIALAEAPLGSVRGGFSDTSLRLVNNLATHPFSLVDGAAVTSVGDVEDAPTAWFVAPQTGDLHLAPDAGYVDEGDPESNLSRVRDIDGDPITGAPDVGADER
jgi:hypothetical protein